MKKTIIFFSLFMALGSVYYFQPVAYEILKLKTFDSFIQEKEESGNFVVLNITEEDIANEGGYPLSRQTLSQIHINLLRQGAMGVGWVMAFPQPDRFGGDFEFTEALKFSPSVLAMFEGKGEYPPTSGTVILGPENTGGMMATGVIQNIDVLKHNASQGIAVARTDADNLIRRLPLLMRTPDGWVSSYSTEVLKVLAGADTYVIRTNDNGVEEVRVKGLPPVKTDSLGRKWISWVVPRETSLAEMDVENRFVFVGFTAKGIMPQLATPVGLLEPHKIQAALAESILIQDSPYIPDYALALELLIFLFSLVFVWLVLNVFGITWGVSFFAVVFASTAFYGVSTIQNGILIDVTWALVSQFITATVAFYIRFREQYKLRQQIKKQFEHYLDKRQVAILQKSPEKLKLGGEKRYATFLFTDVRGFTALSETLEPEQVTYIMNKALTAQQKAVQKNGGMVDKYIGDAMMAIFNAPLDLENHENKAIDCALDIQKNMADLNKELGEQGIDPVAIGIGINSSYAVIGNCGSETRFDYTAIGDGVNVAARLESGTKEAGRDLLIGYNTAIKSDYKLELLEPLKVKGKEKPLEVYTWDLS
jgi:adenylate cyclase